MSFSAKIILGGNNFEFNRVILTLPISLQSLTYMLVFTIYYGI